MKLPVEYDKLNSNTRKAVRKEYIRQQDNKCWYCDKDLDGKPPQAILDMPIDWKFFPKGFLRNPKHIQHDHSTGMTEGVVHAYCNAVLWQYFGR
jgi:hypothetical protein